ncbi:MAG TPA: nucleoside-diphosphate sugar epimerase, partial [Clostridiales bacterium]|nr:nucleoside-diphosphate sugar epimerase [Clostridiales bacterium]
MQVFIRKLTLVILDALLLTLALYLAIATKFGINLNFYYINIWFTLWSSLIVLGIACNAAFKLYSSLWRYAGVDELLCVLLSGLATGVLLYGFMHLIDVKVALTVYFLVVIYDILFLGVSRLGYRVIRMLPTTTPFRLDQKTKKVLIIGAGYTGVMVIKEMKRHPDLGQQPVALLDDDKSKHGSHIMGVKVFGGREEIPYIVRKLNIDEIVIAIPSAPRNVQLAALNECKKTRCKLRIVPSISNLINEDINLNHIRDVQIEDLLGRDPVTLNMDGIGGYITNQVVLVTGGGGSIGSELCRQIARFYPRQLLVLDIYENNAYELQQELKKHFPALNHKILIASVRDMTRLESIFSTYKPDIIFHAAAHKHVPLMEDNPQEAIKNNVFGTLNVAQACDEYGVKRMVLISTDKAVNPTNIMGATKRICELIIQYMSRHSKHTEYAAVRFGNVLGSSGSVIPLFKRQIAAGGPVTVTHPDIIRYFMTIPEAARLVIQAGGMAHGGEIFVLDMGQPVKIVDLARNLIRLSGYEPDVDIKIVYTGLRPGEKLYEELLLDAEGKCEKTSHDLIYIGSPIKFNEESFLTDMEELRGEAGVDNTKMVETVHRLVPTYSGHAD